MTGWHGSWVMRVSYTSLCCTVPLMASSPGSKLDLASGLFCLVLLFILLLMDCEQSSFHHSKQELGKKLEVQEFEPYTSSYKVNSL